MERGQSATTIQGTFRQSASQCAIGIFTARTCNVFVLQRVLDGIDTEPTGLVARSVSRDYGGLRGALAPLPHKVWTQSAAGPNPPCGLPRTHILSEEDHAHGWCSIKTQGVSPSVARMRNLPGVGASLKGLDLANPPLGPFALLETGLQPDLDDPAKDCLIHQFARKTQDVRIELKPGGMCIKLVVAACGADSLELVGRHIHFHTRCAQQNRGVHIVLGHPRCGGMGEVREIHRPLTLRTEIDEIMSLLLDGRLDAADSSTTPVIVRYRHFHCCLPSEPPQPDYPDTDTHPLRALRTDIGIVLPKTQDGGPMIHPAAASSGGSALACLAIVQMHRERALALW